jgi:hypothetical protein
MIAIANVAEHLAALEEKLSLLLPLLQHPDLLPSLSPLHRAAAFLSISKSLNTVFTGLCSFGAAAMGWSWYGRKKKKISGSGNEHAKNHVFIVNGKADHVGMNLWIMHLL